MAFVRKLWRAQIVPLTNRHIKAKVKMETAVKKNTTFPELARDEPKVVSINRKALLVNAMNRLYYRLTHWETWDWRIKYLLIGPAWIWFCLRARSCWFFTASNPTLTFGGFDGESKREMYAQLPPGSFPRSIYVPRRTAAGDALKLLRDQRYNFPFAVKPEVGKMGLMFRRINSVDEFNSYHQEINCDYIIQEWVDYPLEVSVFYYRMPNSQTGTITGFVRKDFLAVAGDGTSTLWDLIVKYPRVQFRLEEMRRKHKNRLHHVLPAGEIYCLSPALNLSRGGRLVSLEHEKDESLLKIFDDLSHYAGKFYYGRYDIKCQSIEDLKQGKNFSILEYNGSGAEPHHVYGNGYSLWEASSILVNHWSILCRISRINNRAGVKYWPFKRGWRFLKDTGRHLKNLRQLDSQTALR